MDTTKLNNAIRKLSPLLSERKRGRIASAVASRTKSIVVVLENIADRGNENAVLRTADAFGFQTVHRVMEDGRLQTKGRAGQVNVRTDAGARNWLSVHNWSTVSSCIDHLKRDRGYKIAAACPNAKIPIAEMDFSSQKLAVAFGHENEGLSNTLLKNADFIFSLPMCGFVSSLNVSVSAAITLYHAYAQRLSVLGSNGDLSEQEKGLLTLQFYVNSLGTKSVPQDIVSMLQSKTKLLYS